MTAIILLTTAIRNMPVWLVAQVFSASQDALDLEDLVANMTEYAYASGSSCSLHRMPL
jgi:hypothetical protein